MWSTANRQRYAALARRGLLTAAGRRRSPTTKSGDAPRPSIAKLPSYIEDALRSNPRARVSFEGLAPSCRRSYVAWLESAKRETTRVRRLREMMRLLAAGQKLGLK